MIGRSTHRAALVALTALGSCLPDYTFLPCGEGTSPAVCIISPIDQSVVSEFTGPGHPVAVQVIVANFTLKAPGDCMGATGCGHIHLRVVDHPPGMGAIECNAPGAPYNVAGASVTQSVLLDLCIPAGGNALGDHQIIAELHDDHHQLIPNSHTDTVLITAR